MDRLTARGIWEVLRNAGKGFSKDKIPKLSASLAYYTIFSLGPMLLVMIFLAKLFWGRKAVEGSIVGQLKEFVGTKAAFQIQEIIRNASIDTSSNTAAGIGFITLLIGATTVFTEIQDSINTIWNLKLKEGTGWGKLIRSRLLSFSIVISLGFILLVSLVINALLEGLMGHLRSMFPQAGLILIYVVNLLLTLVITTILFGIIYKVLPDAYIKWRDVAIGAVFTAVLFMLAKFGITFYIGQSDVGSAFGAAGSLVILLLWIYFSSMILYFGAEFTKAYAMKYGGEIRPTRFSVTVQVVKVETENRSVQQNERDSEHTQKQVEAKKKIPGG